jgi:putative membrane protein
VDTTTTTTFLRRAANGIVDRFGPPVPRDIFGIPTFFIWNFLIILVISLIFYWLLRSSRTYETPMDVLKKRYVSGEIDKETFEAMRKDIKD